MLAFYSWEKYHPMTWGLDFESAMLRVSLVGFQKIMPPKISPLHTRNVHIILATLTNMLTLALLVLLQRTLTRLSKLMAFAPLPVCLRVLDTR